MIKLSAHVSKKVPVPDVEFSSQSYSAGMEIEVASPAGPEELKDRLQRLYGLLQESVEEQIKGAADRNGRAQGSRQSTSSRRSGDNGRGNDHGGNGGRAATEAQVRAIHAIASDRGYSDGELSGVISERFGARDAQSLSIGQASSLIDTLKENGKDRR